MSALWTCADHVNLAANAARGTSMNWSGLICERNLRNSKKWISGLTVCSLTVQLLKQTQGRKTLGVPGSGDLQGLESTFVIIIHWTSVSLHFNLKGTMCFYFIVFLFCSCVLTFPHFSSPLQTVQDKNKMSMDFRDTHDTQWSSGYARSSPAFLVCTEVTVSLETWWEKAGDGPE